MEIEEMQRYLRLRYEEQVRRFPLMGRDISEAQYVRVNLAFMRKSPYWLAKDCRICCVIGCRRLTNTHYAYCDYHWDVLEDM